MSRYRERTVSTAPLRWYRNNWLTPDVTQIKITSKDTCTDGLGKSSDHPLNLTHTVCSGGAFHWNGGYWQADGQLDIYAGAPADETAYSSWYNQFTAQKIVASTAPLKPVVNTITNLLEVRDIPKMLKHAGDLLHKIATRPPGLNPLKEAASANLAWKFGWDPLIGDILKMMHFADLVDKRQKQIGLLNSGKTLRRRVRFGQLDSLKVGVTTVISNSGIIISPAYTTKFKAEAWATVHWNLSDMNLLGTKPSWWEGFRSVYGLDTAEIPIQIWKGLPWSWAIDWFAGFSDQLEISKNLVSYSPSRINLMCTRTYATTYAKLQSAVDKIFEGGSKTVIVKSRQVLPVGDATGIHLRVPFLDSYKLSVLGSFFILKLLK